MTENINSSNVTNMSNVATLVADFRKYATKTAEGILHMSKVVIDAKKLGYKPFQEFCKEIGRDSGSSTIRKLEGIGKKHDLLSKHQEKLPSNWTTLYTISQIEEGKLEEMLSSGRIEQSLSGKEANRLLGTKKPELTLVKKPKPTVQNGTVSGYGVRIQFSKFPDSPDICRIQELLDELRVLGAEIEVAESLEEALGGFIEPMKLAA